MCVFLIYTSAITISSIRFFGQAAGVLIVQVAFSNDYWARMYTRVALLPCHLGFAPTDQRRLTCFLFGSLWPARFYSTNRVVLCLIKHTLIILSNA